MDVKTIVEPPRGIIPPAEPTPVRPSRLQQHIRTVPGADTRARLSEAQTLDDKPKLDAQVNIQTPPMMEARPFTDADATIRPGQFFKSPLALEGQATILMAPAQPIPPPPDLSPRELANVQTLIRPAGMMLPVPLPSPRELAYVQTIIRGPGVLVPAAIDDLPTNPPAKKVSAPKLPAIPKDEGFAIGATVIKTQKKSRTLLLVVAGVLAVAVGFGAVALQRSLAARPGTSSIVEVAEPAPR